MGEDRHALASVRQERDEYLSELVELRAENTTLRARAERAEFVMVQAAIPLEALHADNRDGAKWMCPDLRQAVANAVEAIRRALAARGE